MAAARRQRCQWLPRRPVAGVVAAEAAAANGFHVTPQVKQAVSFLTGPRLSTATAERIVQSVVDRYSEPWRSYHTVRHLGDVIEFLVENVQLLRDPRITLWAALGHDEVYVPQAPAGVNEELSARLSEARLQKVLPLRAALVGSYIRRTAGHDGAGDDTDLALLLDADLKILGAPETEFDEYDANIAKEFSFVPPEFYAPARAKILRSFCDQPRIYVTDIAFEQFEANARRNLERKIEELVGTDESDTGLSALGRR
jgi:predicted metal-dependent HD superfamily phosphohydrolase